MNSQEQTKPTTQSLQAAQSTQEDPAPQPPRQTQVKTEHSPRANPNALGGDEDSSEDRVYISLDCLLDTKLGCIAQNDPELATELLSKGLWSNRLKDHWPGKLTNAQFKKWYEKRDMETLKHSVLTNMNYFLKRLIKDSIIYTVHTQAEDRVVFELNIWPYEAPDQEFVDMLVECLRFHTYSTSSIVVISTPPKELTPELVARRYKVAIMNDPFEWTALHKEYFEKKGIPDVIMVSPMLLDPDADLEEMRRMKVSPKVAFDQVSTIFQAIFKLRMHPVSMFSITEAINEKHGEDVLNAVAVTTDDIEAYIRKHEPDAEIEYVPMNKEIPIDLSSDPDENGGINEVKNESPNSVKATVDDDPFSFDAG